MMKNYNMILIGKLKKYMSYNQVKLVSMNILQVKKHYLLLSNQKKIIEQTKFSYCKTFEKQNKEIEDQGKKTS